MKRKRIITILLVFMLTVSMFLPSLTVCAVTKNTNVLDDLLADESFDISDYPAVSDDYSMNVIAIGESESRELYIYVYQPSDSTVDLVADTVSIYSEELTPSSEADPQLFELELVSTIGVFDKYLVKDYRVSTETYRYYYIVSLWRPYNSKIDNKTNVTTSGIAESVGQRWCCYYYNDALCYEMETFETLDIKYNKNGFFRFYNGITLGTLGGIYTAGDLHYIAFDAENYQIDHIFDARLAYKARDCSYSSMFGDTIPDWEDIAFSYITLSEKDTATITGYGLGAKTYSWNRIMKASDFVATMEKQGVSIGENTKNEICNSQWVFAFLETEWEGSDSGAISQWENYTEVGKVGILRIKFSNPQGVYNLGVVGDLTDSDKAPSGTATPSIGDDDAKEFLEKIIAIALLILLLIVLTNIVFPILKPILKIALNGIWALLCIIFNILLFPLKVLLKEK